MVAFCISLVSGLDALVGKYMASSMMSIASDLSDLCTGGVEKNLRFRKRFWVKFDAKVVPSSSMTESPVTPRHQRHGYGIKTIPKTTHLTVTVVMPPRLCPKS